jgi:selenide,water dikinase
MFLLLCHDLTRLKTDLQFSPINMQLDIEMEGWRWMTIQDVPPIKLTSYSSKGGCGCKIGPGELSEVLRSIPASPHNPNLLVGIETSDDAGVYQLNAELALVQTVDFFTPIVDDPYSFGQIAAANAISDIYAMGGKPLTVLNIVAFPIKKLDKSILADILRGAAAKVQEAGATLVGGHSIDDQEPKFGLAVTGLIHPQKVKTNAGAMPGDQLLLTKPIGVGILTTSIKKDMLDEFEVKRVTEVMSTLNKKASEVMNQYTVHACTDVTGFGLLGHTAEIAKGSHVGVQLDASRVPFLPRVRELAEAGFVPGGSKNNHSHVQDIVSYSSTIDEIGQWMLCDAVTSGGLLISVAPQDATALLQQLIAEGVEASWIGEVVAEHPGHIKVNGHV